MVRAQDAPSGKVDAMLDGAAMESWMTRLRDATAEVLPESGELGWLLRQSVHTHPQRLSVLPVFSMAPKPFRVLDVGAGTGAMSFDLAWLLGAESRVTAVDSDASSIALLRRLASTLGHAVEGRLGDAYDLPVDSGSQDLTVSRFVLQHLDRPAAALAEMKRVTAPGGLVAVLDVDDDARLAEAEEPPALARLNVALGRLQAASGGDRRIGRRLYGLFRDAGLSRVQVIAMPRVRLGTYYGRDAGLEQHHRELFLSRRQALVEGGFVSAAEFEAGLAALDAAAGRDEFGLACEFLAIGRVKAA